jgi:hypothetical protein
VPATPAVAVCPLRAFASVAPAAAPAADRTGNRLFVTADEQWAARQQSERARQLPSLHAAAARVEELADELSPQFQQQPQQQHGTPVSRAMLLRVEHALAEMHALAMSSSSSSSSSRACRLSLADYRAVFTCLAALRSSHQRPTAAATTTILDNQARAFASLMMQQMVAAREEAELAAAASSSSSSPKRATSEAAEETSTLLLVSPFQVRKIAAQASAAHVAEGMYQLLCFDRFVLGGDAQQQQSLFFRSSPSSHSHSSSSNPSRALAGKSEQRLRIKTLLAELRGLYSHPLAAARAAAPRVLSELLSAVPVVPQGAYCVWFSFEEQGAVLNACKDFGVPHLAMELWPRLLQQQKLLTRVSLLPKLKPDAHAVRNNDRVVVTPDAQEDATFVPVAVRASSRGVPVLPAANAAKADASVVIPVAAEELPPSSRLRYASMAAAVVSPRVVDGAHAERVVTWSLPRHEHVASAPIHFASAAPVVVAAPPSRSPADVVVAATIPVAASTVTVPTSTPAVSDFPSVAAILSDPAFFESAKPVFVEASAQPASVSAPEAAPSQQQLFEQEEQHVLAASRSSSRAVRESFRPRARAAHVDSMATVPRVPFHVLDKLLACIALSPAHGVAVAERMLLRDMQEPRVRDQLDLSGFPQVAFAALATAPLPAPAPAAATAAVETSPATATASSTVEQHLQELSCLYARIPVRSAWTHEAYFRALCLAGRYQQADGVFTQLLSAPGHAEVADEKLMFFALHSVRTRLEELSGSSSSVVAPSAQHQQQQQQLLIERAELLWRECKARLTPPSSRLLHIMLQCHSLVGSEMSDARQLELLDEAQELEAHLRATMPIGATVPRIATAKCFNFATKAIAARAKQQQPVRSKPAMAAIPVAIEQHVATAAIPAAAVSLTAAVAAPVPPERTPAIPVIETAEEPSASLEREFERAFAAEDFAAADAEPALPVACVVGIAAAVPTEFVPVAASQPAVASAALPIPSHYAAESDLSYAWTAESVQDALASAHAAGGMGVDEDSGFAAHSSGGGGLLGRVEAWIEQRALRSSGRILHIVDRLFGPHEQPQRQQTHFTHAPHSYAHMRAL